LNENLFPGERRLEIYRGAIFKFIFTSQWRFEMAEKKKRSGTTRRIENDRRSGADMRSEKEKQTTGERRSKTDRRVARDRRGAK
jgi:hypothetical protein